MKRLSRKQLAQRKKDRRKSRVIAASPILVQTRRESGSKRKGKSMKKSPVTFRNGNVTTSMLQDAPADSLAYVNSCGTIKMLAYKREIT